MKKLKNLFPNIMMMLSGAMVGVTTALFVLRNVEEDGSVLMMFVFALAIAFVSLYIHLILHEAGHLIFGLLSGYDFVSFRIRSLILVKEDGRYKLKRYSLAGTGGQCLMSPPDYNDGNYPYVLYNLGGIIVNMILVTLFGILYLAFRPTGYFGFFFISMMMVGVAIAMSNGIPMQTNMVTNDGHNALNLSKDKDALKTFWATLKINAKQMEGVHLADIDPEWFTLSENADLKNTMVSPLLGVRENLLMEQGDFDGAKVLIDKLLSDECSLNGITESLVKLDGLYIDLMERGADADMTVLDDKKMKSFVKAMKNYPSVLRTTYAAAKVRGDNAEAERIKSQFSKIAASYPYKAEIETEQLLMARFDA